MNYTEKNVLIISHNPLSRVNNNGKTLASLFEGLPKENIYQIYLNHDIPDYSEKSHYLQLNEKQIISSIMHGKNLCCQEVKATPGIASSAVIKSCNFGNHTKRILRECVWKFGFWKPKLLDWLKDKQFDVVFFMAGDGLFAYDVYRLVMSYASVKGCLFFTDDYIIGRTSYSPVALLRQCLLKRKMEKTLKITNELYVISEKMRQIYGKLFRKDGYVIRNFSVERKNGKVHKCSETSDCLTMVYAGGLHYNRWKVLGQIGNALKKINESSHVKCQLKIYSSQKISNDIINQITVEDAAEFMGSASAAEIADIYAKADVLLHVESFEKKAIASTKYSFSTKIPEYLSSGKCVLGVGPADVASMQYLKGIACTVSNNAELSSALMRLINDAEYRKEIALACEAQYENDFSTKRQEECLVRIMSAL